MNTFTNALGNEMNYKLTENGGVAHKSTMDPVYDMFAFGGAYRSRSDEDVILLFKKAFEYNPELALKCLFYLRDVRGGQGERRFFRVCWKWLAGYNPAVVQKFIEQVPEYGRWDDLFVLLDTPVKPYVINLITAQLKLDMLCQKNAISLLAKWMPSCNASSKETKARAKEIRNAMGITEKDYRKMLSLLRDKINVLEKLMSANEWDKIEFDKIPSKAGLIYRNAFARRDILAKKYEAFAKDKDTKVNAKALFPYEIVGQVRGRRHADDVERAMLNKYWENLPDYLDDADCSMMCVIDTSGSMTWNGYGAAAPIDVAISLGLYCAERMSGPFANQYISFASRPQLIKTDGVDFVDKVERIYRTNLCDNTDLDAVFNLLLNIAKQPGVKASDLPKTIVVISDMEIDEGTESSWFGEGSGRVWSKAAAATNMERIREEWARNGLVLPNLVYWNVNARHDTILDAGDGVSFVSGCSPIIFKQVLTGKTGYDLMLETLNAERYARIHL